MEKKYLAILLSICLGFGTVSFPIESYAAESRERHFPEESVMLESAGGKSAAEREGTEPDALLPEETMEESLSAERGETEPEDLFPVEEAADQIPLDGLLPIVEMELPETAGDSFAEDGAQPGKIRMYYADAGASYWDKYANYYFYNQMNAAERAFWDSLEAMCNEYLINNKEAIPAGSGYRTELVSSMGLGKEDMKRIGCMFRYSNPQYYFLNNVMWFGTKSSFSFGVYTAFAKKAGRAAATQRVRDQIESWQTQIDACGTEAEKVKHIHDLIIQKVEYNNSLPANGSDAALTAWEDKAYSQSAYSVFCTGQTVCAGYSQAFELMCNGSGIDAVAVTSHSHEWNKVRIDDSWYNVDCTWDDQKQTVYYSYFERSDAVFDRDSMHHEEDFWEAYLPACTLDSGAGMYSPGVLPQISRQASSPVIQIKEASGSYIVTLKSDTPDADIYYSLDGVPPEIRAVKCYKYAGSFEVIESALLQAVAVSDCYWDSSTASRDIHLEKKYTITYKGNGATAGSMRPQVLDSGSVQSLAENRYVREGYRFAGWNTLPDGSGAFYENGAALKGLSSDMTLYAQWKLITYTLRYRLDGGVNGKNPAEYNCTQSITLAAPKKTGYTFRGWYADSNYKHAAQGISAGSTGDKVFYAKWSPNTYRIVFQGNGSSGTMTAMTGLKYDVTYKLPQNSFKKPEYTFCGWNTRKDGSGTAYKNKQSIRNLTAKAGGSVTLYAQWARKSYAIAYELNGGKNNKKNPASYTEATATVTLKNPTRTGYEFLGWYRDSKYKKKVTGIPKGSTGSLTLYARWKVKKYKITYNLNGGKNNSRNASKYDCTSKSITLKNPARTGYTFKGWYSDRKFQKKVTAIKKGSTGNKIFYARWEANPYTVKFDGNGADSGKMNALASRRYAKAYPLPPNRFKREGYAFTGWNTQKNGRGKNYRNKQKVKNLTSKKGGTVTLYAQWKKK